MWNKYCLFHLVVAGILGSCTPVDQLASHSQQPSTPDIESTTVLPTLETATEATDPKSLFNDQTTVAQLLLENGGCELPCYWGIEAGITRWKEAEALLSHLEFKLALWEGQNPTTYRFQYSGIDGTLINGEIEVIAELVGSIAMRITTTQDVSRDSFSDTWQFIQPERLLEVLGKPSRILIGSAFSPHEPSETIGYEFWLFYDREHFLIRFSGVIKYEEVYLICPSYINGGNLGGGNNSLDVFFSSELGSNLDEMSDIGRAVPGSILELEKVSSFTLEDYYSTFITSHVLPCLEIPHTIWP